MAEKPLGKELVAKIKAVRLATTLTLKEARDALEAGEWDVAKAIQVSRHAPTDRPIRIAQEGQIFTYIHHTGKIGSMVELRCETDFAARSDLFKQLGKDLAIHFCAVGGTYFTGIQGNMDSALAHQWVKDPTKTINELVNKYTEVIRESIWIKRAISWKVADGECMGCDNSAYVPY